VKEQDKLHDRTKSLTQAARQGLAVLMASAVVVLKHKSSTTYQSHIYESIDLKFVYGDHVTRFSNPAKFGEDHSVVAPPRGGEIYGSRAIF